MNATIHIDDDRLYTSREAGEILGISATRVRALSRERFGDRQGRDWLLTADQVRALVDRQAVGNPNFGTDQAPTRESPTRARPGRKKKSGKK